LELKQQLLSLREKYQFLDPEYQGNAQQKTLAHQVALLEEKFTYVDGIVKLNEQQL
jgi:hypothetical protein